MGCEGIHFSSINAWYTPEGGDRLRTGYGQVGWKLSVWLSLWMVLLYSVIVVSENVDELDNFIQQLYPEQNTSHEPQTRGTNAKSLR